jgi:hypothetical protein
MSPENWSKLLTIFSYLFTVIMVIIALFFRKPDPIAVLKNQVVRFLKTNGPTDAKELLIRLQRASHKKITYEEYEKAIVALVTEKKLKIDGRNLLPF